MTKGYIITAQEFKDAVDAALTSGRRYGEEKAAHDILHEVLNRYVKAILDCEEPNMPMTSLHRLKEHGCEVTLSFRKVDPCSK